MLSPPERMTLDKQTKKAQKNPERKNMESKISPCWFCTLHCVLVNVQRRRTSRRSGRSEWGGGGHFGGSIYDDELGHQFGRKTANTPPNFRGGAEKVVVHMHWLTWLVRRLWV